MSGLELQLCLQELLRELVEASQIKARCKWKDIYPTFQSDERYLNLLGNPGSNPLELFWDVVDQLDQNLDAQITLVEDGIKQYNKESDKTFTFGHDTTVEEFRAVMAIASKDHEALQNMPDSDLQEVYEFVNTFSVLILLHFFTCWFYASYVVKHRRNSRQTRNVQRESSDTCKTTYDMP